MIILIHKLTERMFNMMKRYEVIYYLDFESTPRSYVVIAHSPEEAVGKTCWRERGKAVRVDIVNEV